MRIASQHICIVILAALAAPGVSAAIVTEDFEDDQLFDRPSEDWYTLVVGNSMDIAVRTTAAQEGNSSLEFDSIGNSDFTEFDFDFDLCDGGSITFWYNVTTLDGSTPSPRFIGLMSDASASTGYTGSEGAGVRIFTNAANAGKVDAMGTPGDIVEFENSPLSANTWYDFTITGANCSEGTALIFSTTLDSGIVVDSSSAWDDLGKLVIADDGTAGNPDHSGQEFIDSISVQGVSIPPDTIGSSASVAVDNLVGFDISPDGTVAITRQDTGANVTVHSGVTLAENGRLATANCNRQDGVAAISTHIFFVDCESGTGDADIIRIRNPLMGDPEFPPGCGSICQKNIAQDFSGFNDINVPDDIAEMFEINFMGSEFYRFEDDGLISSAATGFTFSDTQGRVGIFGVVYNDGDADTDTLTERSVDPSGVNDACAYTSTDDQADIIAAVSAGGPTKAFQARLERQFAGTIETELTSDMATLFSNTGALSLSAAIACEGGFAIVATNTDNTVKFVDIEGANQGAILWSAGADPADRSVAISDRLDRVDSDGNRACTAGSGRFVAWLDEDSSTINIANATDNGAIVATVTKATGTLRGVHMDRCAQNLYVGTDDFIERFQIYTATSITPASSNQDDFGNIQTGLGPVEEDPGDTLGFGNAKSAAADAFGTTETLAALFFAAIVMIALAVWASVEFGSARIGAPVGAASGLVLSLALGFIGLPLLFGFVLLATGFVLFRFHSSRGE